MSNTAKTGRGGAQAPDEIEARFRAGLARALSGPYVEPERPAKPVKPPTEGKAKRGRKRAP